MGRYALYPKELTEEILSNAAIVLSRSNALLAAFGETRKIVSGWRPPAINASTPNAAARSLHMTGQAIDLFDPNGDLDKWTFGNTALLADLQLWQEHPSATKGWAHYQIIPPRSGNRIFYP